MKPILIIETAGSAARARRARSRARLAHGLGRQIALFLTSAVAAGCAVGPNYHEPPAPTSRLMPVSPTPRETPSAPAGGGDAQRFTENLDIPGEWWTLFQSEQLNALITRALTNNPTLDSAQAALRQANETVAAERGAFFPSVTGNLSSQRQKGSGAAFGIPGFPSSYFYNLQTAQVSVAYTLDVFGGTRRQVEALQAQADYERYSLEATYLTLTSNIVVGAINEASLRAQIAANEDIARSQQRQLEITNARFKAGGASRADVLQQQSELQSTLAGIPPLRSALEQQRHALAAYIGSLPADYDAGDFKLDSLKLPDELPVSLPSKLVEQRPDVREYSALLHEATAQVGVATANMLPQITLTGSYGQEAASFSHLFDAGSNVWGIVGSLAQPIFKGGQLLHQRRAAVAAAQEAAANYKATVITAFQNVADSLSALQADADTLAAQVAAAKSAADSLALVQVQYKSGGANYLQVLTAEQTYQTAALALVKARAQRYSDTAALFQSLGGGWWNRNDVRSEGM